MEKENIMYQKLTLEELKKITGGKYVSNAHGTKVSRKKVTTCILSFFRNCK